VAAAVDIALGGEHVCSDIAWSRRPQNGQVYVRGCRLCARRIVHQATSSTHRILAEPGTAVPGQLGLSLRPERWTAGPS
jgi:hypothetical protein